MKAEHVTETKIPREDGEEKSNKARVEFLTSTFTIDDELGSQESIRWLNKFIDSKNKDVFRTKLKYLIDYKWSRIKYYVYAY